MKEAILIRYGQWIEGDSADLFGVDACSSHLYLGDGSGEFRDVPVLPAAPENPKRNHSRSSTQMLQNLRMMCWKRQCCSPAPRCFGTGHIH